MFLAIISGNLYGKIFILIWNGRPDRSIVPFRSIPFHDENRKNETMTKNEERKDTVGAHILPGPTHKSEKI